MAGEGGINPEGVVTVVENAARNKSNKFKEVIRRAGEKIRIANLFRRTPNEAVHTTLPKTTGENTNDPFAPPQLSPLSNEQFKTLAPDLNPKEQEESKKKIDLPSLQDFPEKARPFAEALLKIVKETTGAFNRKIDEVALSLDTEKSLNTYNLSAQFRNYGAELDAIVNNRFGNEYDIDAPYSRVPYYSSELVASVQSTIDKLNKLQEDAKFMDYDAYFAIPPFQLQKIIDYARLQQESNESLATSSELLTHTFGYSDKNLEQILLAGKLMSRKKQIETFGEANFTSAVMKVGKDWVEFSAYPKQGQRMSREEYNRLYKQGKIGRSMHEKHPFMEENQILFERGTLYRDFDLLGNGMALAFRETDVLGETQFNNGDGIHVFDKHYKEDNPESPGYEIDLTKKPFLIVIKEGRKDMVEKFIREKMATSPLWQDIVNPQNVDEWISKTVFIIPDEAFVGTHAYSDPLNMNMLMQEARQKMLEEHEIKELPKGYVMPSGEYGDTAAKSRGPLAIYKHAA